MSSTIVNQLLVAGSVLLAGLPVGCSVSYPSVLLRQLAANDSSIQLDWETSSWIGSIHGVAALPSILVPTFMQWRGRKLAFILACLVSIIGWIVAFTATSPTSILISESLHGFSSQSIVAVGMLSMSEMLSPRIRTVSMGAYFVMQTLGMSLVCIMGNYLHWRTVTLVICAPLIVVVLAACMWPESPAWLACKGKYDKCTKSFIRLRGTGDLAQTELKKMIIAQKENLSRNSSDKKHFLKTFWQTLKSRDFYLPGIHMFTLLFSMYWIGELAILIYSSEIIQRATFSKDTVFFGGTVLNIMLFLGAITSVPLTRYFKPKIVLLGSSSCSVLALFIAAGVNFFQISDILSKDIIYLSLYMIFCSMFTMNVCSPIVVTITAELMPVKYRGIGGPLYVTIYCFMHTTSLKLAPYMLKYMNLWGMLLVFAACGLIANLSIWIFVPETKGKTLQQLEDYYAYGSMEKRRFLDVKVGLQELNPINEN